MTRAWTTEQRTVRETILYIRKVIKGGTKVRLHSLMASGREIEKELLVNMAGVILIYSLTKNCHC